MSTEPEEIANDFALKILDGIHEILIFPNGEIKGWPVARQYSDGVIEGTRPGHMGKLVVFNRVPSLVEAAEKVGYALGYSQATEPQFFVENAVPDSVQVIDVQTGEKQLYHQSLDGDEPEVRYSADPALKDWVNGRK